MRRQVFSSKKQMLFAGIALLAIIITTVITLAGGHSQAGKGRQNADNVKPVVTAYTVTRQDLVRKISLTGQTVPESQTDIAAKYAGRITDVNVNLGDTVTTGQVLVVQDTTDVDLSIAQNEAGRRQAEADVSETQAAYAANYQKALADYQRCQINYERYKSLFATGAVSRENLDTAQQQMVDAKSALDALANQKMSGAIPATIEGKRAALDKAVHSIEALGKQREDLILRAPRSGVIGYRQAEIGAWVQPGQKLLSVVDNSKMYVDCLLSEQDAAVISTDMPAVIQIESLGKSFNGTIIYVSPANDAKTQSFTVRLALINPDQTVKSGMFARSQLELVARRQTLSIPKEAVQSKNGKTFVYIINAGGQVQEQAVELGLSTDQEVEVLQGIREGDQIAVTNLSRLKPGMAVTLKAADSQAGGETP